LIIVGEYGFDREWGKGDIDDGQRGRRLIRLGSEAMDDGGVKLVRVREVKVEAAATSEAFGAQGALVKAARGMKDECVILELAVAGSGEDTVGTVERRQERRHIPAGERRYFCRCISAAFMVSRG